MPVEWVVGGMAAIISTLSGVVVFLFRKLLERIDDAEKERDEWKSIALSGSRNLGELVPAVSKLGTAVESEHVAAQEFRAEIRGRGRV